MGVITAVVVTVNATSTGTLEDTGLLQLKSETIEEPYIVEQNISSYVEEWDYPELPRKVHPADNGQCVKYARALSGIDVPGDAKDWKALVNAQEPKLGSLIVFDYDHGATVVAIDWLHRMASISERNYFGEYIVNERWISLDAEDIVGYIDETFGLSDFDD